MPDAATVLTSLRMESDDELTPLFYQLEDLWERKLWHQLTQTAFELFQDERSRPIRYQLFNQFLVPLEEHINALSYVTLAILASEVCESPQASLHFLQSIADKIDQQASLEVYEYARLRIASTYIQLGDLAEASKIINNASKLVDELSLADQVILATFYGVSCEYYKVKQDYTAYYRHALLYLACISADALSPQLKQQKAYDLAISALLGDKIYNFGELILHPILASLSGEYTWLRELVEVVNQGDIPGFQRLKPSIAKVPLLESSLPFLDQKICLMALMECVFKRPTNQRTLSFDAIARDTKLQQGSKVEILVLKAFSLGLIEGSIDQVDRTVTVTWLQPRVLSREQMALMRTKLGDWDKDVDSLVHWMQNEGAAVWS